MTAFSGSALYARWVYSGGTAVLSGNFRTFSFDPDINLIVSTAGATADESYVNGVKTGQAQWTSVMQSAETALQTALAAGVPGTLEVGPEGTVTGKPKLTIPAISKGLKYNEPYNDIVTLTCSFTKNGALGNTTW